MYSVGMAYLLWLPSLFGLAGLQRFYLGKFGTGVLFLITGGLFGFGTFYDAFTLPRQVREAQLHEKYREALEQGTIHINVERGGTGDSARNSGKPTSVEQIILQSAKQNNGVVTPTDVALAAGVPLEEARRVLEQLSDKGFAEVRVKKSGLLVYVIPDFEDEHRRSELDDL